MSKSVSRFTIWHNISKWKCSVYTVYKSITLENSAIICATNKYYGKPWFSNISVCMNFNELFDYTSNEGICYGQVIV